MSTLIIESYVPDDTAWYDNMLPYVTSISRSVTWKYRKWVEQDDVAQTIWEYYLQHKKDLDRLSPNPDASYVIRARLRSAAVKYARAEMAYHMGMDLADQYTYSRGEIRALLEYTLSGGPQGREGQSTWAGYSDLTHAMAGLSAESKQLLAYVYGDEERESLTSAERAAAWRVVGKLQEAMNSPVGAP